MSEQKKQYDNSRTLYLTKLSKGDRDYYFTKADPETFDKISTIKPGTAFYLNLHKGKEGKKDFATINLVDYDDDGSGDTL